MIGVVARLTTCWVTSKRLAASRQIKGYKLCPGPGETLLILLVDIRRRRCSIVPRDFLRSGLPSLAYTSRLTERILSASRFYSGGLFQLICATSRICHSLMECRIYNVVIVAIRRTVSIVCIDRCTRPHCRCSILHG